ncbi:MAG: polyprenyl synthetase family protein [Candidatus Goldbacteria bacterium]|nr:polyprenyl synthetase family protein [Candidatus Goldiibacteriota bacterium]
MFDDSDIKKKLTLLKKNISYIKKNKSKSIKYIFKNFKLLSGKNIRGLLVLITAEGLAGKINMSVINTAIAIELLHHATLIHDDIIDNSYKRRGDLALNRKIGYELSVLTGDYLFSYVNRLILKQNISLLYKIFSDVVKDICEGEIEEIYNKNNPFLKEKEYFQIIKKKTAALIRASVLCGSVLAKNTIDKNLSDYGLYTGIAFQIKDDILDISSNSKKLGKPVGCDIKEGKATLPFILAFKNANNREKKIMKTLFLQKNIKKLTFFIKKNNGINDSLDIARNYIYKAKKLLNNIRFKNDKSKIQLERIADYIINRNY